MKKFAVLLYCVIFVVSFCGCNKNVENEINNNLDLVPNSSTSSIDEEVVDEQVDEQVDESLYEKLIREIDGAYLEEQKAPENSSTIGMIELSDKYTEKWKQVADEYYNKIMEYDGFTELDENNYSSDDLHTFVSNMKTNWEEYNEEQCTNYMKTLQTIYGGGTIVGPIFADYKYEMQKDWALQLVGIYQQLYVE